MVPDANNVPPVAALYQSIVLPVVTAPCKVVLPLPQKEIPLDVTAGLTSSTNIDVLTCADTQP